jgi:hypothetical protein
MMSDSQLKLLLSQCADLEATAGITELIQKAQEGRLFPLGIDGQDCTSDEYFADEHDYFRKHLRDAYFSVSDPELRISLIAAYQRVESEIERSFKRDVLAARRAELLVVQNEDATPWWLASVFSVVSVAIGNLIFQTPGAIAGAIAGYFLGNGIIQFARINAKSRHRAATETLRAAIENLARHKHLHPKCFKLEEWLSGERDRDFDTQSALVNVREKQDNEN